MGTLVVVLIVIGWFIGVWEWVERRPSKYQKEFEVQQQEARKRQVWDPPNGLGEMGRPDTSLGFCQYCGDAVTVALYHEHPVCVKCLWSIGGSDAETAKAEVLEWRDARVCLQCRQERKTQIEEAKQHMLEKYARDVRIETKIELLSHRAR